MTATLLDVSVGTEETPVRGSGRFVAGHGDREGRGDGGTFTAGRIQTGHVVTDGGIAPGTPDKIAAGVFVVSGATVDRVEDTGSVTSTRWLTRRTARSSGTIMTCSSTK